MKHLKRAPGIGICCLQTRERYVALQRLASRAAGYSGACAAVKRLKTTMCWSMPLQDSSWGDTNIGARKQLEERMSTNLNSLSSRLLNRQQPFQQRLQQLQIQRIRPVGLGVRRG